MNGFWIDIGTPPPSVLIGHSLSGFSSFTWRRKEENQRQWYFSSTAGAGEREAPSTVLTQVASRSSPLVRTTSGHGGLTSHCLHLYFIACWHSGPFQGHHTPGAAFKHRLMGVGVQIPQLPCPWGRKTQVCVYHAICQRSPGVRLPSPTVVTCLVTRPA